MRRFTRLIVIISIGFIVFLQACSDQEPDGDIVPSNGNLLGAELIFDQFEGKDLMIYKNASLRIMLAFEADMTRDYQVTDGFPNILKDENDNKWNVFGEPTTDPTLENLTLIEDQIIGYWFSIASFFPKVTLESDEVSQDIVEIPINDPEWAVNTNHIAWAAIQDGIPSIDDPKYFQFSGIKDLEIQFSDQDLFAVLRLGDQIYAYPYNILDWHEVLNDNLNNTPLAVTYCPLTGTAVATHRAINGETLTFGVSGLLYNNNLIVYDRENDNFWSQIAGRVISGEKSGTRFEKLPVYEMNWRAINKFTNLQMLSVSTGFNRDYLQYPYGDYRSNHERISYSLSFTDDRIAAKEKVLGVKIGEKMKVYQF